jgi:hypothetical protein
MAAGAVFLVFWGAAAHAAPVAMAAGCNPSDPTTYPSCVPPPPPGCNPSDPTTYPTCFSGLTTPPAGCNPSDPTTYPKCFPAGLPSPPPGCNFSDPTTYTKCFPAGLPSPPPGCNFSDPTTYTKCFPGSLPAPPGGLPSPPPGCNFSDPTTYTKCFPAGLPTPPPGCNFADPTTYLKCFPGGGGQPPGGGSGSPPGGGSGSSPNQGTSGVQGTSLVSFPASRPNACTGRSAFVIRVRRPKHGRIRRLMVYVNGHRTQQRRGRAAARTRRLTLNNLPAGTVQVRVVLKVRRSGRLHKLTSRRTYHTCTTATTHP